MQTRFQGMSKQDIRAFFLQCCQSNAWAERMLNDMPYDSKDAIYQRADANWQNLAEEEYLQAFRAHPMIGNIENTQPHSAQSTTLAKEEQSGVENADTDILQALKVDNQLYLDKFGFIFIVCATHKSAQDMLQLLQQRLGNDRDVELKNAIEQQRKITRLRLEKCL